MTTATMISPLEAKIRLSYLAVVGDLPEHAEWMEHEIIDALGDMITPEVIGDAGAFVALHPWIPERIRGDRERDPVSRLPVAVVLYLLVQEWPNTLVQRWWPKLNPMDLRYIFTALGFSSEMLMGY